MTTKKATTKKSTSHKKAREYLGVYIKDRRSKSKYDNRMKLAKEYLLRYATEHRDKFDDSGNLNMPGGYLHFGKETVVQGCDSFNMAAFLLDHPDLVDHKFKTAAIKAILQSEAGVEKLTNNHCITLEEQEKFDIVIKP